MIKFLRKFQSFIRDDRGIVGEHGILASIAMYGMGILGLALLAFPGRMVLPDSPIASQPVLTIQMVDGQGVCTIGSPTYILWMSHLTQYVGAPDPNGKTESDKQMN